MLSELELRTRTERLYQLIHDNAARVTNGQIRGRKAVLRYEWVQDRVRAWGSSKQAATISDWEILGVMRETS